MRASLVRCFSWSLCVAVLGGPLCVRGDGDLQKVNHVVVVMQENHSFDNYFGALPYVPGGPYHPGPCGSDDHACVDGLTCTASGADLACSNSNRDDDGGAVRAFHSRNYCPGPDLRHDWPASHQEANYLFPALTWLASPNNGFVLVNDGVTATPHSARPPRIHARGPVRLRRGAERRRLRPVRSPAADERSGLPVHAVGACGCLPRRRPSRA